MALKVFPEMTDIWQPFETVSKKHLESEPSCLVDWEHETMKGEFTNLFKNIHFKLQRLWISPDPGTADSRFFSL